jgi:hypothetical protein
MILDPKFDKHAKALLPLENQFRAAERGNSAQNDKQPALNPDFTKQWIKLPSFRILRLGGFSWLGVRMYARSAEHYEPQNPEDKL